MRRHSPRRQKRRFSERIGGKNIENPKYDKEITALLVIDPYNDFISEGDKFWDRLKTVAEANGCIPHMLQVLNAARKAELRGFYALHRRYRPGDYETWKYIAPVQKASWLHKAFEYGTWGGEIRSEFEPQPGEIVALEHWGSSGFANTDLDLQLKKHGIHQLIVIEEKQETGVRCLLLVNASSILRTFRSSRFNRWLATHPLGRTLREYKTRLGANSLTPSFLISQERSLNLNHGA